MANKLAPFHQLQYFQFTRKPDMEISNPVEQYRCQRDPLLGFSDDAAARLVQKFTNHLAPFPVNDPAVGQWRTYGFIPPINLGEDVTITAKWSATDGEEFEKETPPLAYLDQSTGVMFMAIQMRERVLPKSAIDDAIQDRAKQIEEKEQRELNRKDYAEIKDILLDEMLPSAPVRRSRFVVALDGERVYVTTTSVGRCDELLAFIRKAFGTFPVAAATAFDDQTVAWFHDCLDKMQDIDADDTIQPYSALKLVEPDSKAAVSYSKEDLDEHNRDIVDLLNAGYEPVEMGIRIKTEHLGKLAVKLNKAGIVKEIAAADDVLEELAEGYQSETATALTYYLGAKVIREVVAALTPAVFVREGLYSEDEEAGKSEAEDDDDDI